ncbi:Uma2 family endonuclease [Pseudanabaena sp. PCC 6802]|uniref:Uma2 family endonuclease n=1 Tax=Pseudanabaena sp. PCC 6802 TaxID=118173 RepID=UPI000348CA60|nr:Uma2 family endonuclease [Pseudanabaena sp. PCC 6802]
MTAITINLSPSIKLTDEQFLQLCQSNPDLRLERTAQEELIVMPPTGWGTGNRNSKLNQRLGNWADADGTGLVFDSSTGFTLPNGADRSPDASWVRRERLLALQCDPAKFLPMAPDFVAELRSETDNLEKLQRKMQEYIKNGVRLGWLLDPKNQRAEIYRPGKDVEVLFAPTSLSGEDVLPGFVLDLAQILS